MKKQNIKRIKQEKTPRLRRIKKIGNSYFIALSMYDMKDFGLREKDVVDISDLNLLEFEK